MRILNRKNFLNSRIDISLFFFFLNNCIILNEPKYRVFGKLGTLALTKKKKKVHEPYTDAPTILTKYFLPTSGVALGSLSEVGAVIEVWVVTWLSFLIGLHMVNRFG